MGCVNFGEAWPKEWSEKILLLCQHDYRMLQSKFASREFNFHAVFVEIIEMFLLKPPKISNTKDKLF